MGSAAPEKSICNPGRRCERHPAIPYSSEQSSVAEVQSSTLTVT